MLQYQRSRYLPSAEELPDSDDAPVDNQLQHTMPVLLETILAILWSTRMDWFFGSDMGIYDDPDEPATAPDGFLALGVERIIDEDLRLSYPLWEENLPIWILEVVSQKYRGEYSTKKKKYAEWGVLYYTIYNPRRRRKPRFEVYRLVNGEYVLQAGNPVWMPEIGLGIGCERRTHQGITREWLYWYDESGKRYLTPEELAQEAERRASESERRASESERRASESERRATESEHRAALLAEQLRALGIDPDSI
jgi:Uma2 family endonuclease